MGDLNAGKVKRAGEGVRTREDGNLSEKELNREIVVKAADAAWVRWHGDMPVDDIPMMSLQWEKAFVAGVMWLLEREVD
jgi:hypothetical protein